MDRVIEDWLAAKAIPLPTTIMASEWTHAVRFIAEEDGEAHLGQVDPTKWQDVGLAVSRGQRVDVNLISGSLFNGQITDTVLHIALVCRSLQKPALVAASHH